MAGVESGNCFEESLVFPTLAIRYLAKLIEQNQADGRRTIRPAVREG